MTDSTDPTQRHPQQQGSGDPQGLNDVWGPIEQRPPQTSGGVPGLGGGMPGQGGSQGSVGGYPPVGGGFESQVTQPLPGLGGGMPGQGDSQGSVGGYPPVGGGFESQVTQPLPGLGAGTPGQQGFSQQQTGVTGGYPNNSGFQQSYGQQQMGYPYQPAAENPTQGPKYSKNQILVMVGALVLIVGAIASVALLNRSTTPAAVTSETPTPAQPSPTATRSTASASATPSVSATPSPTFTTAPTTSGPAQPPGVPVAKQKLSGLVFPAEVDNLKLQNPKAEVMLYDSTSGEMYSVAPLEMPDPASAKEVLEDREEFPGGVCGKLKKSMVCLIEAKDGVILVSDADDSSPKIKSFTLRLLKLLGG